MSTLPAASSDDRYRAPRAIFWTAFLVRVAYIVLGHTFRITPINHHFEFGWETGRVAASLAQGHGYSSPFSGNTGPTAWMVPGFTLLLAGVFKLFGVYTPLSAFVIQTIDCLFQALTVPLIFEMAMRVTHRRNNAVWAAWIWALYPGIIQYGVKWIWETSLSTLLFTLVLVVGMRMRGTGEAQPPATHRARNWALFGLLWGAISMTNPTLLLMAPVEGVWILAGLPQRKNVLKGAAFAVMGRPQLRSLPRLYSHARQLRRGSSHGLGARLHGHALGRNRAHHRAGARTPALRADGRARLCGDARPDGEAVDA